MCRELIRILESLKNKMAEVLNLCSEYRKTIDEAARVAKEIEAMVDEWLRKAGAGTASRVEESEEQAGPAD